MKRLLSLCFLIIMIGLTVLVSKVKGEEKMITAGEKVRLNYNLTIDGEKVDSSPNKWSF